MTFSPASFPSPPRDSISIGPLDLRAYGLMIALGVIAAVWLAGKLAERKRIGTTDDVSSAAVWGVAAGIIGARLYHVVTDWDRFADDLGAIPQIWKGGLGIPGGLLFGAIAGTWQAKRRGIPPSMMLTIAAPAIPLAQAIGRWGNYFNQELYGRPSDLPWALEIDADHLLPTYPVGTTFHPTFLYESLWNLALVVVLLRIDRRLRLGPGRLFGVYMVGYGIGRFWVEGLRIDPASELAGLRLNQWMALAVVAAGAAYLFATRGRTWPADAPAQAAALRAEQGLPPLDFGPPRAEPASDDDLADRDDISDELRDEHPGDAEDQPDEDVPDRDLPDRDLPDEARVDGDLVEVDDPPADERADDDAPR